MDMRQRCLWAVVSGLALVSLSEVAIAAMPDDYPVSPTGDAGDLPVAETPEMARSQASLLSEESSAESLENAVSPISTVPPRPSPELALQPQFSPHAVQDSVTAPRLDTAAIAPPPPADIEAWLAQVDPGRDRFPDDAPPAPLPPEAPLDTPRPTPLPSGPGSDVSFFVADIQVTGSTRFDDITLEGAVAPFEERTVTLAELQQAADAITQLYLNEGHITSRAILNTQTVVDGVVQIQVIEGSLEAIEVEGTERLQAYVRDRVALGAGTPLNQTELEDRLRLLRGDVLFESVEASLRAGSDVGKSLLIVRVVEARSLQGSISSDNYSPSSVGDVRFTGRLEYLNPAGFGDRIFASASWTDTQGSKVYELGYSVPLNPRDGTLTLRLNPNEFRITDSSQPIFGLNVRGETDIYELSFRQPLHRTPRDEFALSAGLRYRTGSTLVGDGFITNASRTTIFSFGQDYIHRGIKGAISARSQFRLGRDVSDVVNFENTFLSWIGQIQRVQLLTPDNLLVIQGDVQLASTNLPGSEQFFIGGGPSVRGYAQNQRFGDNGIRLSIEDQITLTRNDAGEALFRLTPFLEGGYVWNSGNAANVADNNFLLGTGFGLLVTPLPDLSARFDLAIPLIDVRELATDPVRGARFYFSVGYQF